MEKTIPWHKIKISGTPKLLINNSSAYSSSSFVFSSSLDGFPFTATSSVSNISVAPPVIFKQIHINSN